MRQTRRKNYFARRVVIVICILALAVAGAFAIRSVFMGKNADTKPVATQPEAKPDELPKPVPGFVVPLRSSAAQLTRVKDAQPMMASGVEDKIYPASLTKIMTALVVIEELPDLQKKITLPKDLSALGDSSASVAGFAPGETVKAIDLLYGVMLPSGAECCLGLSNEIAGGEDAFAELMNKKAKELKLKNTHFTNPSGLHDKEHYTTVADLTKTLEVALKNKTFREVFTAKSHTSAPTNRNNKGLTYESTLFSVLGERKMPKGAELLGGKTGFTSQAGQCLASLWSKDGEEYILVTVGAKGDPKTEQLHIDDAFTIMAAKIEG